MIPRPRRFPAPPAWPALGLAGLLGLGACLEDHPLLLPGNAYDPAQALRGDSLSRFDTVEIVLVDVEDSTRVVPVFRGRPVPLDALEPKAAGDGRTLVYVVRGWSGDRGQCYLRRVSRDGITEIVIDSCAPKPVLPETTSGPGGGDPPGDAPRPPGGRLRGRVVSALGGGPEAGWSAMLSGSGTVAVTGGDGGFDFGRIAPGDREVAFSKGGRIGRTLRVRIVDGDSAAFHEAAVLPAAELEPAPLAWSRRISTVAAAAGHAVAPSSEFEAPGQVAVLPLDNPSPSLQRYLDQGNCGDDPAEGCFEAGDAVADSGAVYIAYPQSGRLGRIGSWLVSPAAMSVSAGLEPSALLLDGGRLLALGRIPDGRLALGAYDAASLSPLRADTLAGLAWDGVIPLDRGPRLASHRDAWYAVDGNGPAAKGRLIRIDKATRKVEFRELPESEASDVAIHRDQVLVTFAAASARSVRAYALDLAPLDTLELGRPGYRIAIADTGRLAGYAFVANEDNGVSVIEFGSRRVVGRLALPGLLRPRALAVDAASARLLVTDGRTLFQAGF